jgi:hypothetical protein
VAAAKFGDEILNSLSVHRKRYPDFSIFICIPYAGKLMTEQNRNYIKKEIGKLLSEIWRIKALAEQEYGPHHSVTKKLVGIHEDVQALMHENSGKT